jgi:hypothetical protein
MPQIEGVWGLHHGGELVAGLLVTEIDFPWMRGRIEPLPAYDKVRGLFEAGERAMDADDADGLDEAYYRIRAATSMTFPDGSPVAEYMLEIFSDGTCGWRWNDEAFDEPQPTLDEYLTLRDARDRSSHPPDRRSSPHNR